MRAHLRNPLSIRSYRAGSERPPITNSKSSTEGGYEPTNPLPFLFQQYLQSFSRNFVRDSSPQCLPSRRSCLPNCSISTTVIGRRIRYLASDSPWRRCQARVNTSSLLSLVPRSSPSYMTRSGARTPATLCRIRAPISHSIRLYTKYNNGRVSEGLGRRGNQSRVEHVVISSGKANVVSGVGRSLTRPDRHHLDADPLKIQVIARGTTAASFVHGVSMPQTMQATTSAFSLPNSPGVVVTAGTLKHGACRLVAHTTPQQKARVKPQRLSLATSPISQTHNQSWTKRSRRNCRRRCERRWPMLSTSSWILLTTPLMNHPSRLAKRISDSSPLPIL